MPAYDPGVFFEICPVISPAVSTLEATSEYVNGSGKRQSGESGCQLPRPERGDSCIIEVVACRKREKIGAEHSARPAPIVKTAAAQENTACAVAMKVAYIEVPPWGRGIFIHPCCQASAQAVVGIDRHHVRRTKFTRDHETAETFSVLVQNERRMIAAIGNRIIDRDISYRRMAEADRRLLVMYHDDFEFAGRLGADRSQRALKKLRDVVPVI